MFSLSRNAVIAQADESLESRAFATIIKNRVNRGGILAKVASFIKNLDLGMGIGYSSTMAGFFKA
jgi:DNA adenine methylase